MASNDSSPKALPSYSSKDDKAAKIVDNGKAVVLEGEDAERMSISGSSHIDDTHRMLKSRHIQLIGIGGTIGTVLFVQIGQGLIKGGPGSLFIAFSYWCTVVLAVTMCMAEMVTYLPISSPFVRFAGRYVDEALGFAAGWNFFIFEAALVPFEVTACNIILQFWTDKIPTAVVIIIIIILYALINVLAVRYFGEVEFWAAIGKVILIVGLIIFTFIAMLGGNPKHERFGFTYWQDPGAFKEAEIGPNKYTGALGKWLGFLQCLVLAAFTIAGPDYVSMAAGETANPRKVLPRAFNAVFYRLTAFFVLGSLCVGILVPYNSVDLIDAYTNGAKGAAASPYVVAMKRLGISGLPHVVNAAVLTAAFSAGNSYLYCASRSLYGLALEGKAPRILTKCTKSGIPIYCTAVVLCFALLAFLQLGKNSSIVLNWFVSLVTASQLLNFATISLSYICFHKALKAQGISRDSLPYKAWFMPYGAYYSLVWTFVMAFVGGWTVFLPGNWDIPTFLFSYMMIFIFPALYVGYKIVMRTKIHKSAEVDLVKNLNEIEEHERTYMPEKSLSMFERILDRLFG